MCICKDSCVEVEIDRSIFGMDNELLSLLFHSTTENSFYNLQHFEIDGLYRSRQKS